MSARNGGREMMRVAYRQSSVWKDETEPRHGEMETSIADT